MAYRNECDACGLADGDLPDGVDADLIFEPYQGQILCQACLPLHQLSTPAE